MATLHAATELSQCTYVADVNDWGEHGYVVSLTASSYYLNRFHVVGLQLHEAESIAAELLAAVKRARTLLADADASAPASDAETPSEAP